MGQITDYIPTKEDVKGMFKDSYVLITKFQDMDILIHQEEINAAFHEFEEKYNGCQVAVHMAEAAIRALIGYKEISERIKDKG